MKVRILVLVLMLFGLCLIQGTVLVFIEVAGIRPNLLLIFTVLAALLRPLPEASITAITSGLFLDILSGRTIGWYALLFFLVSIGIASVNKNLYMESIIVPLVFVMGTTFLIETVYYLIRFLLIGYSSLPHTMLTIIVPEILYNCLIAVLGMGLMRKLYQKLDVYDFTHTRL